MRLNVALFGGALLLTAPALRAQPTPERLPDLTPREFEVVGEVRVDLPQIERQPLSGFGPPPRTYVVPAERRPATAPYAPDLDGLGAPTLAPPTVPDLARSDGRRGRVEGGVGRYLARYARFDLALPAGPGLAVADVDYDALNGDANGPDPYVAYGRFAGRLGWRGRGPVQLGADVGGARDVYDLLATGLIGSSRRVTGLDVEARLDAEAVAAPFALGVRASRTRLDDGSSSAAATDARIEGDGRLDLANDLLRLDAAAGVSTLGGALDGRVVHYAAGGALRLGQAGGPRLELGVRTLGYDAGAEAGGGSSRVVAPVVAFEAPFGASGRLFARSEGRVVPRGLADVLRENPFVVAAPRLAPDVRVADAAAGLELRRGLLGLRLAAEATYAPTHAFFERGAGGLFEASYAEAYTVGAAADLTLAAPSGAEASVGAALRRGRLTEFDEPIPYFATLVGRAGVQVPVTERGRIGLAGAFEGPRPADRGGLRDLPAWGALTFDGAYDIRSGLAATLRAERLLGRAERWEGFPQPPFTVVVGARYVFE